MWLVAMYLSAGLMLLTWVGTELLRSHVHRRRVERDGLGGTQDIAIGGMALMFVFEVATAVALIMWIRQQP